jgi:predicted Zn-dependent protease
LSEEKDATLWGPVEVDGSAGSLQSDAIVQALAAHKAKAGSQGLVLTLTPANSSDWEEVHFSLLRGRQEQELNAQLDFWATHTDGLALRLGRGYIYTRNKLFAEAAGEYDSALSAAPESPYLLKQAIDANQRAGRASRVQELQKRLATIDKAPNS